MADYLESLLTEKRVFEPDAETSRAARIQPADLDALYRQAESDHEGFWAELAHRELDWQKPFTQTLDDREAPFFKWFTDGELNASVNCLDRHLESRGEKTAIVFEGEDGDVAHYSYRDMHTEVCRFANALLVQGVGMGDRVIIYMPMIPQAVMAMLACARIGAIHSVVFGGFSAGALRDRINDCGAKAVITADGGTRGGKRQQTKQGVDDALADGCDSVASVFVYQRTGDDVPMTAGRDIWWHEAAADQPSECEPARINAEHPLYLLYTSGSTGKPKGIQHSTAGYLLGAVTTCRWVFDLRDDDVFWCTADVGWVTGHTYVAYGPLACGATQVIYEGAPTVPNGGRFWKLCQDHCISVFYTAPTAIRALMKLGDELPKSYDRSSLRLLGTVGEPINPEAWMWYYAVIGEQRCPVIDTWWQTETGAHMIAPLPGVTPLKPGSCTRPLPGIAADIVDEDGHTVTEPDRGGYLVIKKPWPSMLRTIWGDPQRYVDTYWPKFNGKYYLSGDSAHKDADGYFWIMGRIDDVVNVSGHRLGTMEVESALVAHERVAEAAVVGVPHEVKGEGIHAFVVLRGERPSGGRDDALASELREWVDQQIGPIARPEDVRFADNLPKTRSGKIMRRLLRDVAQDKPIEGDVSTLENPAII
ncbi:MAG: acetate--CoA ligase, partial [Halofilum sp. (in: g-proteobacteria)]